MEEQNFSLIKLKEEHLPALAKLEEAVYAAPFRTGLPDLIENLKAVIEDDQNLSWGLFHGENLVGYLIVWIEKSCLNTDEDIIFIDDVLILPQFKSKFVLLYQTLRKELLERGLGDMCLEGVSRRQAFELYTKHPLIIRKLGYEMVNSMEFFDSELSETLFWTRFAPADNPVNNAPQS